MAKYNIGHDKKASEVELRVENKLVLYSLTPNQNKELDKRLKEKFKEPHAGPLNKCASLQSTIINFVKENFGESPELEKIEEDNNSLYGVR